MCSVEHCSSVPISLCGFQVTELALTTRNIAVTGTWDNYYLIIPSTIKKCPESPNQCDKYKIIQIKKSLT